MTANAYRFEFEPTVPLPEAEMSLHLAMYAVEGLYGEARVRLEANYQADEAQRTISVDGASEVGAAIVKVYTSLLLREYGADAFRVRPTGTAIPNAVTKPSSGTTIDAQVGASV